VLGHAALQILPFGTPAARVTFVSVLCSAGASALIYLTLVHLFRATIEMEVEDAQELVATARAPDLDKAGEAVASCSRGGLADQQKRFPTEADLVVAARAAAVVGAGLYSFSPLVWMYSTQAEVFSLNNLFVAALVFLTALYLVPLAHKQTRAMGAGSEQVAAPQTSRQAAAKAAPARGGPAGHADTPAHGTRAPLAGPSHAGSTDKSDPAAEQKSTKDRTPEMLRKTLKGHGLREHRLRGKRGVDESNKAQSDRTGARGDDESSCGSSHESGGGFYWRSANLEACEVVMLLVPGSGSSDAGLWSSLKLYRCPLVNPLPS